MVITYEMLPQTFRPTTTFKSGVVHIAQEQHHWSKLNMATHEQ